MKKKIKDLTSRERQMICNKTSCLNCPLQTSDNSVCIRAYIADKNEIDKMMEKEIEVEE